MHRGFRFRLYPTKAQAAVLDQWAGVVRLVYNLAWEQRRDWYRQFTATTGRRISFPSQSCELTDLRAEFDWIQAVPRTAQEQALRDLDAAFISFFKGNGFPGPRKRGEDDRFRFKGIEVRLRKLNARWGAVVLPKLGPMKVRLSRDVQGDLCSATISCVAGKWFISFLHDVGEPPAALPQGGAVGIDRGIANTISLSTGEHISVPRQDALTARTKRAQRVLARRKRGSRRYAKQRARVAALRSKSARIRTDALHKASTAIVRRYGVVAMEALKIGNMTTSGSRKRGLNRSILEQGWGIFGQMLAYKLEATGGRLLTCSPAYTSQTCSGCGVIDKRSRESQAVFSCIACGHHDHADTNAAKNILLRSTEWLHVEGQTTVPAKREPAMAA